MLSRWKIMAGILGISIGGLAAAASQFPKWDRNKDRSPEIEIAKADTDAKQARPSLELPEVPAPPQLTPAGTTPQLPAVEPVLPPSTLPEVPVTPPEPTMVVQPIFIEPVIPNEMPKPATVTPPMPEVQAVPPVILPNAEPVPVVEAPPAIPPLPIPESTPPSPPVGAQPNTPANRTRPVPTKLPDLIPPIEATTHTAPVIPPPTSGESAVPPLPSAGRPQNPPDGLRVDLPPLPPAQVPQARPAVEKKFRILLHVGDDEPTFEVKCGDNLLLKVACDKVDIKSPEKGAGPSEVIARGNVRFVGFGAEGTCEELKFFAGTGQVEMNGDVKVLVKDKLGRVESELTSGTVKYKLDSSSVGGQLKP